MPAANCRQHMMKARDLVKDSLGNLVSVFSKKNENRQRLLFERSEFRRCLRDVRLKTHKIGVSWPGQSPLSSTSTAGRFAGCFVCLGVY